MARFIPVKDTNGDERTINFDWVSWIGTNADGKTFIKLADANAGGVAGIVTDMSYETLSRIVQINTG